MIINCLYHKNLIVFVNASTDSDENLRLTFNLESTAQYSFRIPGRSWHGTLSGMHDVWSQVHADYTCKHDLSKISYDFREGSPCTDDFHHH